MRANPKKSRPPKIGHHFLFRLSRRICRFFQLQQPALLGLLCLFALLLLLLLRPWLQPIPKIGRPIARSGNDQTWFPPTKALLPALGKRLWSGLAALNCSRLLANGANYVDKARRHRLVQRDGKELAMDCHAVKARWKWPEEGGSSEEGEFPLAFARTVFRDYLLLEQMLSVEYAPQNLYCYAVDAKADSRFKRRIRALAGCFDNVFVANDEFSVFSNGKNVSRSHLACLRELERRGAEWKYAILLQNHDIPLHTNAEMVRILRAYNGTNAVATRQIVKISVNRTLDWSLATLRLYRNESQSPPNLKRLQHTKSLNLIALSRPAVTFALHQLNLDPLIDQLETSRYGMDEVLFSTLNSNLPDFPGGFTTECLFHHNRSVQSMGRYTIWHTYGTQTGRCLSNHFRHDLCIYGVEDLVHIGRARLQFYLNKMLPSFDFGAIFCWLSTLAARRFSEQELDVNEQFYRNLPHVLYNRLRAEGRLDQFRC